MSDLEKEIIMQAVDTLKSCARFEGYPDEATQAHRRIVYEKIATLHMALSFTDRG
jgi:hypothetical protein